MEQQAQSGYSVEEYVAELKAITAQTDDPQRIIEQVRPLAQRMAENRDSWLKPEHYKYDEEQGVGLTVLHEEPDHTLAVFAVCWGPGKGVPPHNHGTWAVVAGVDGPETNTFWKRVDDGSKEGYAEIVKAGSKVFNQAEVLSLLPDGIHSVSNEGDKTTVSLHTYGMHVNYTSRSQFDPETNEEKPFILDIQE